MNRKERMVQFYDISINASSRTFDAPVPIQLLTAFKLMCLVPKVDRQKAFSNDSFEVYFSELEIDVSSGIVTMLVNKCDKAIADPTFTVPSEGKRRVAAKTLKEGQDFSAHMVIKVDAKNSAGSGILLLEQCPGLNATLITNVMSTVLNNAKAYCPGDFIQVHPDGSVDASGKPKTYNVKYNFLHVGHPSEELIQDIDEGKLQSIELVTQSVKNSGFDTLPFMKEECESILLKPQEIAGNMLTNWAKTLNVFKNGKAKYATARVRFKNKSGIINTVTLDTETAASELYVKKVKIDGFNAPLKGSYDAFNIETIQKMKALA